MTHELAHALADRAGWHGTRIFNEGFAEAFGFNNDSGVDRLPIRQVVENFALTPDNFYTAGLFVRFLVEDYGLDRFAEFMRATGSDDDFATVSASFEDAMGVSIEDSFAASCAATPQSWAPAPIATAFILIALAK